MNRNEPIDLPATALAALLLAVAPWIAGCGSDETPGTEAPPAAEAAPSGTAPAEEPETAAPARSSAGTGRHDVPVRVTEAPAGTAPDAPALLRGVARLEGKIPQPQPIAMDHIAGCKGHEPAKTETVIATPEGELQNVVVYVVRGLERDERIPAEPVDLTQRGCRFFPHIAVVHAGQTLRVRNEDDTNHNVNAKPAHASNPAFNRMQPAAAADLEVVFPRAEIGIPIGCDIHTWMKAYVAVVEHSGWAISDGSGAWAIEVPPGDYLVEAWHEKYGTLKGSAEVRGGETAELEFTFEAKKKQQR
jgi:hypothetical protein